MKDLSLHILDLARNSIDARADHIKVSIKAERETGVLGIIIEDNGAGMDKDLLEKATDPFATTRTTRRVGLGIPLMKASAERSGGSFGIRSEKGKGTVVEASFAIDNIDRPPLGDIAGTLTGLAVSETAVKIELLLANGKESFKFDTEEIKQRLGGVPITEYAVVTWMKEYLNEGIKVIFGGVLNEVDS